MGLISRVSSRTYRNMAPWWILSRQFIVSTGARFFLTPMQITIKRFAEQSPAFRAQATKVGRAWHKTQIKNRFKKNNVERTPEEIECAARITEQKAVVICAEFLSSLIGTAATVGITLWLAYDSYQASKLEKAEHKKEQKDLAAHFKELEEENKALRLSLQNLTEKVEKQELIAAAETNQQAEKQNSSSIKIQNNSEIIKNLSSKLEEIQFEQKKFKEHQQFEQKEQND